MVRVALVILGCSKNQVDAEAMEEFLDREGFFLTEDTDEAEVVVIHTCGFIEAAREESINTILEAAQLKETGNCRKLIVTGCLAQKYGTELFEEIPEIDALTGTGGLERIAELVKEVLQEKRVMNIPKPSFLEDTTLKWDRKTGHTAYVKIAEGCDHRCSFCVIPELRGPYVSRTMESINKEAERLVSRNVKEVILIAQDTTLYGKDLYGKSHLAKLLDKLSSIDNLFWLRVLYAYPQHLQNDILEIMALREKICSYLDLPLQHSEEKILKAMGRPGSRQQLLRLIDNIRGKVPGITLRSTFIVGFPGETDVEFQGLLKFLRQAQLDWVGFFPYSREEGTAAGDMTEQIPEAVKLERYQEAVNTQKQISKARNKTLVGKEFKVLVDEKSEDKPGFYAARGKRNAPEVDGMIYIKERELKVGSFTKVKITGMEDYDLIGECVE